MDGHIDTSLANRMRPSKRWLLINDYESYGGAEEYVAALGRGLTERGSAVEVLTAAASPDATGRATSALPIRPRQLLAALKSVRDFSPDVVVLNNVYHEFGWLLVPVLDAARSVEEFKLLIVAHDLGWRYPNSFGLAYDGTVPRPVHHRYLPLHELVSSKWDPSLLVSIGKLARYLPARLFDPMAHVDLVVSPSMGMAERAFDDLAAEQILLLMNPVRPASVPQPRMRNAALAELNILLVSRFDPGKGVGEFLESAPRGVDISVAGDGAEAERVRQTCEKQGFEYLGWLNASEVVERARRADLLVIPTIGFENCPMTALTAVEVGTPVAMSTSCGALQQFSRDGLACGFDPAGGFAALELAWNDFMAGRRSPCRDTLDLAGEEGGLISNARYLAALEEAVDALA